MDVYHAKLKDIRDGELLALIEELERACPADSGLYLDFPLSFFLTQCIYPEGAGKRVPISTESVIDSPLLEARVGALPDGMLRELCGELADKASKALECYLDKKLYVFLNKTLPKVEKGKAPGAKQVRWDAVIRQRRSNR